MLKKKTTTVFFLILGLVSFTNAQQQTSSLKSCESPKAKSLNVSYLSNKNILLSLLSSSSAANFVNTPRTIILQNYIRSSSVGMDERGRFFSELSPKDKSDLVKFHFALQFVKHPEFNGDQKQVILDSILIAAPEAYVESNRTLAQQQSAAVQQRAIKFFSQEIGSAVFANFSGTADDVQILNKYVAIVSIPKLSDRQAVISKLTPFELSLFYRIQMAFGLVIPTLAREQQELILAVIDRTKPEIYSNRDTAELAVKRESLRPLIEQITKTFPNDAGITTFAMIGDIEIDPIDTGGLRCHCLLDSWFSGCGIGSRCQGNSCDDNPNNGTHCGFAGLWSCNGRCS